LPLAGVPKDGKPFDHCLMTIEGFSLLPASIQAQVIVKGIRRIKTATIETLMRLRKSCGIKLREAECFATTR